MIVAGYKVKDTLSECKCLEIMQNW